MVKLIEESDDKIGKVVKIFIINGVDGRDLFAQEVLVSLSLDIADVREREFSDDADFGDLVRYDLKSGRELAYEADSNDKEGESEKKENS